jgi:hypothetical protein
MNDAYKIFTRKTCPEKRREGKQTIQGEQMFKAANGGWYKSTKAVV